MLSFAGPRPTNLGVSGNRLQPCPNTPNCVCSYDTDAEHAIAPLSFATSPAEAMAQLKQVIEAIERTQIITQTDDYLYAEFTSKLMGFVDDVEFYLDRPNSVIQVRSASRLGKSDLGVNRKRIEFIRAQMTADR
jgi:uncharacterized protein (DUF1499 family)